MDLSVCSDDEGPQRVELFGLPFACVTQESLLDEIGRWIRQGGTHWIVTANVQHVGMTGRDATFRSLLTRSDLITADGEPICWVARAVGRPLPARVTGSDLIVPLAARAQAEGWRLFFLGGQEGVASEMQKRFQARFPGLQVVGTWAPPDVRIDGHSESADSAEAAQRVREARPDVLLVAFGTPKQEWWIDRHLAEIDVSVAVGVGASFDFQVGAQQRAPEWLRRNGAEWLHRAMRSPLRLGPRYLREGWTFFRLALQELQASRS